MFPTTPQRSLVVLLILLAFAFSPLSGGEGTGVRLAHAAPAGLSGTKTICSGGDYATLTAAIVDVTAQRGAAYRYRVIAVTMAGGETPLTAVAVQMPAT